MSVHQSADGVSRRVFFVRGPSHVFAHFAKLLLHAFVKLLELLLFFEEKSAAAFQVLKTDRRKMPL